MTYIEPPNPHPPIDFTFTELPPDQADNTVAEETLTEGK
jgi:hypothetical protein